jgi:hypothetical protein
VTLYALEPDADPERPSSIRPFEQGGSYLADAVALWRLVDDRRADALREFVDRAEEADPDGHPHWSSAGVQELVDLLSGLEERLADAGVLDASWMTPIEAVPELARRVPGMDARPERTELELQQALAEVVFRVQDLRAFLDRVLASGWDLELS